VNGSGRVAAGSGGWRECRTGTSNVSECRDEEMMGIECVECRVTCSGEDGVECRAGAEDVSMGEMSGIER